MTTPSNPQTTLWGIHGGRDGAADTLFLGSSRIALGWAGMGDMSSLPPNRDAFKTRMAETHPDAKAGAVPVNAGQLYRFVHEMQIGDLIAYPSGSDHAIHIGRVQGAYQFDPVPLEQYPHQRAVTWLKHVPRTSFTQGALYEIGAAMSLFQIKNYADEYLAVLDSTAPLPPVVVDPTVGPVTASIEEGTSDFILKRLSQELKGHPFADFVAHLLGAMGYRSRVSPPGADGGIDILAYKDELGFEPPIIKVQVKSGNGNVGQPEVSALLGTLAPGEYALVVTLGGFTPPARNFAKGKSHLRLIGGAELVELVLQHYEQFDARYKGLLPLKRIYVPEALEEGD